MKHLLAILKSEQDIGWERADAMRRTFEECGGVHYSHLRALLDREYALISALNYPIGTLTSMSTWGVTKWDGLDWPADWTEVE